MLNLTKIHDIKFDGIDVKDYPKFCDAFISSAKYEGRDLTEAELDDLKDNHSDWFYEKFQNYYNGVLSEVSDFYEGRKNDS
jgi:hypothetical protein